MIRFFTSTLVLCLLFGMTSPLLAQGKGKSKLKNLPPVTVEKEDESRVTLAFDPGSHTRPISALGFNKDQTQLITVGWDYSIQIWSACRTDARKESKRFKASGNRRLYLVDRTWLMALSISAAKRLGATTIGRRVRRNSVRNLTLFCSESALFSVNPGA